MKFIIKILTLLLTITLFVSTLVFSSNAASSATLSFNKSTGLVGDKITVTATINPGVEMYGVTFYLDYNKSVLEYTGGSGTGSAGVIHVVESPSGDKSVSYTFNFTAKAVGTSNFVITDCVYSVLEGGAAKPVSFGGASANVTIKNPELSSDATLKSLNISGATLSPAFSPNTTSYTASVPFSTEKVSVTAKTRNGGAKVTSVTGHNSLKVGDNTIVVTVQAANGATQKYTVTLKRLTEEETAVLEAEQLKNSPIQTTVDDSPYLVVNKIPPEILFKGFTIEVTNVNGHDIETAVDANKKYRLFYLKADGSEELVPYLYDSELDKFEKLKYTKFGENTYIFESIPKDFEVPETLYQSSIEIAGFTIDSLTSTDPQMSEFHYIYCFKDGISGFYRFDTKEGTLQRYPDFEVTLQANAKKDNIFTRFASLSKNGKVIIGALFVLILGILALFVLLIVYLIRHSINRNEDTILYSDDDDFEEIEVDSEDTALK